MENTPAISHRLHVRRGEIPAASTRAGRVYRGVAKSIPLKHVELGTFPIKRFRPLLDDDVWSDLETTLGRLAAAMRGHVVWNVNSTARGGGVAEMLASLIPYSRGAGIDERWAVIEGTPDFFEVTKRLHTFLHGVQPDGAALTEDDRREYEAAMARNSAALLEQIRPADIAILHDPQTAGLIPELRAHGVRTIWRSHIGVDEPNQLVRDAWGFLLPYIGRADAVVFSRQKHVWDGLERSRVEIIPPCIDPFGTKNQDLTDESVSAILKAAKILPCKDGAATFKHHDRTRGRVARHARLDDATLPYEAQIVLQVSRWDRLKDPIGVMQGFAEHVAPRTDAWLVLAGPAATSVNDDPEQPEILHELAAQREGMPAALRERIVVAQLPMEDTDENAAIVNALQRRADVVVQKSIAEGFGLTVAEAMWKAKPVVAGRVGGIEDQLEHGKSGLLVDDPRDLPAFGDAVVSLLTDGMKAKTIGRAARRRVVRFFITPCHLVTQGRLLTDLVST